MADVMKAMGGGGKRGPMAGLANMLGFGGGMPMPTRSRWQELAKNDARRPAGARGGLPPTMPALPPKFRACRLLPGLAGLGGKPPGLPADFPGLGRRNDDARSATSSRPSCAERDPRHHRFAARFAGLRAQAPERSDRITDIEKGKSNVSENPARARGHQEAARSITSWSPTARSPRDGRFIERLGYFNPLLPKDKTERLKFDLEKVKAWLAKGAQPTDRVLRFLDEAGVLSARSATIRTRAIPRKQRKVMKEEADEGRRSRQSAAAGPRPPQPPRRPPAT